MKCLGCGDDFEVTNQNIVPTTEGRGVVGYCSRCENALNIGTKKSILSFVIGLWGKGHDDEWQAALDYVDKKR